jgi:hypothetical protein
MKMLTYTQNIICHALDPCPLVPVAIPKEVRRICLREIFLQEQMSVLLPLTLTRLSYPYPACL